MTHHSSASLRGVAGMITSPLLFSRLSSRVDRALAILLLCLALFAAISAASALVNDYIDALP